MAPVDEVADRELLVQRGDDDRQLGVGLVAVGDEQPDVGVVGLRAGRWRPVDVYVDHSCHAPARNSASRLPIPASDPIS